MKVAVQRRKQLSKPLTFTYVCIHILISYSRNNVVYISQGTEEPVYRDCYGTCICSSPYIRYLKIQFLLSISDFTTHVKTKLCSKYFLQIPLLVKIIHVLFFLLELTRSRNHFSLVNQTVFSRSRMRVRKRGLPPPPFRTRMRERGKTVWFTRLP